MANIRERARLLVQDRGRIGALSVALLVVALTHADSSRAFAQAEWSQRSPAVSPPARGFHAMAYDSVRARVVLFGGSWSSSPADTWEWDGTTWRDVTPALNLPARVGHALAYDSARHRVVLFGGWDGSYLADTREWDGATWHDVTPTVSPSARWLHALAYDSRRGRAVLFGGYGSSGYLADTWEWDGTTWRNVSPAVSPPARYGHALAYDSARGRVVLFGGYSSGYLADTWEWDGTSWYDVTPTLGPPARSEHAMAYDSARGRVVLFGGAGSGGSLLADTWESDGTTWRIVTSALSPPDRQDHALAYDSARGSLLLFGGNHNGGYLDDTWEYPGPEVLCDGTDNNFNGIIDEGCDDDLDGYCNSAMTVIGTPSTCPNGGGDCNDANPNAHPDAVEVCDGYDTDCDGQIDNAPACDGTCDLLRLLPITRITTSTAHSMRPTLAWTGSEYALAWDDMRDGNHEIYFQRLDASGKKLGNAVRITNDPAISGAPSLVWTGSEYGLAWEDDRDKDDFLMPSNEIYFAHVDPSGQIIGPEVRVTNALEWSISPSLAWNGSAYGLAWGDARNTDWEIYFVSLDSAGNKTIPENRVTNVFGEAELPSLSWTGSQYGLAWNDARSGSREIYFVSLDRTGMNAGQEMRITNHYPYSARNASLAWSGTGYGLAWMDPRTGALEIWASILNIDGTERIAQGQLTNTANGSDKPSLAWTGEEFGFAWSGRQTGSPGIYFSRLSANGVKIGPDILVSLGIPESDEPSLVWTGSEYGVAWQGLRDGFIEIFFARIGCSCVDSDLDGFTVCEECNDADPGINPGATEACNHIDDDCNLLIDDDAAGLDSDADGIHNACDNCRFNFNPAQVDTDRDRAGNSCDNCLTAYNPGQQDLDADQRGDACDNCPSESNTLQDDTDTDRVGDVCDNCIFDRNVDQHDLDNDFEGDVCDLDDGLIYLAMPSQFTVAYQEEQGYFAFNIYRGSMDVLRSTGIYTQDSAIVPGADQFCGEVGGFVSDSFVPPPGKVAYYLASGVSGGGEGTLGTNSAGAIRPNDNPCP